MRIAPHLFATLLAATLAGCGSETDTTTLKGANGETMTVRSSGDGEGQARIEMTNDKGEKVASIVGGAYATWPAKAPAYAAAYPGATILSVIDTDADGKASSMATFETGDAPAQVIDHYKALAAKAGLGNATNVSTGDMRMFTAGAESTGDQLYVQTSAAEGKTTTTLSFTTKRG